MKLMLCSAALAQTCCLILIHFRWVEASPSTKSSWMILGKFDVYASLVVLLHLQFSCFVYSIVPRLVWKFYVLSWHAMFLMSRTYAELCVPLTCRVGTFFCRSRSEKTRIHLGITFGHCISGPPTRKPQMTSSCLLSPSQAAEKVFPTHCDDDWLCTAKGLFSPLLLLLIWKASCVFCCCNYCMYVVDILPLSLCVSVLDFVEWQSVESKFSF